MIKFTTQSGARYLLKDNAITRLAEHPVRSHGEPITPSDLLELPIETIHVLEVGSCALFTTVRGPLRTTKVITMEETDD